MNKKLILNSFDFFYDRLVEDVIEFEQIVGNHVQSLNNNTVPIESPEENDIYKNVCLLYHRLANEYENLVIESGGELPKSVTFKIEKIHSIGEVLNTFQTISEIRKGNYGSPEDWD